MIKEEDLAQEFTTVVNHFYPKAGAVLHHCHVKVIESYVARLRKRLYYIGIYCPEGILTEVQAQKDVLKEVAENMGLVEVVCLNATRLLRDPMSNLQETKPRLWLELQWLVSQGN